MVRLYISRNISRPYIHYKVLWDGRGWGRVGERSGRKSGGDELFVPGARTGVPHDGRGLGRLDGTTSRWGAVVVGSLGRSRTRYFRSTRLDSTVVFGWEGPVNPQAPRDGSSGTDDYPSTSRHPTDPSVSIGYHE